MTVSYLQRILCHNPSLSQLEQVSPAMVVIEEEDVKGLTASSFLQAHAPVLPSRMQLLPSKV